jgi:hypothetical protein
MLLKNQKNNIEIGAVYERSYRDDGSYRIPIIDNHSSVFYIQKDTTDEDYYYNPYMFYVRKVSFLYNYKKSNQKYLSKEQIEKIALVMLESQKKWAELLEDNKSKLVKIIK